MDLQFLMIKDGRISFDLNILEEVLLKIGDSPIVVISINGAKRLGKSYILSLFLRYLLHKKDTNWRESRNENFSWRNGAERNTTGSHIWSEPIFIENKKGQKLAILLIDTQGSFDDETTMTQDASVFAFSLLLSSVLIFNVSQDLGEDSLQFLQYFTGFAKLAFSAQSDNENSTEPIKFVHNIRDLLLSTLKENRQKLLFLIRNWQFNDYKYGYYDENIKPTQQAKNFVDRLTPNADMPAEKQFLRSDLQKSFGQIGCFLLPHPGPGLARNDREDRLDRDFEFYSTNLVRMIFKPENLVTKKIHGIELTGRTFFYLIRSWAELFEGSELPNLGTLAVTTSRMQSAMAKNNSLGIYRNQVENILKGTPQGMANTTFEENCTTFKALAIENFGKSKIMCGLETSKSLIDDLSAEIELLYTSFKEINDKNLLLRDMENKRVQEAEDFNAKITQLGSQMNKLSVDKVAERKALENQIQKITQNYQQNNNVLQGQLAHYSNEINRLTALVNRGGGRRGICTIS